MSGDDLTRAACQVREGGVSALHALRRLASQEAGEPETVVETHAAWVVLAGAYAYKLKRPVRTAYLDFTEPDVRRAMLAREAELTASMTPWLEPRLRAITQDRDGALAFDGEAAAIDWTLRLRRFPARAALNHPAATPVDEGLAERLAACVWALHAKAPTRNGRLGRAEVRAILDLNLAEQRRLGAERLPRETAEALARESEAALARVASILDARAAAGWIRRCHGDLHLGNVFVLDGEPRLFDALEFDERLAEIDVLYDLAFLMMDLQHRGWRAAARRLLEAYLERHVSADAAALDGLAALPLFCAMRASIRAEGAAARAAPAETRQYLQAALAYLAPRQPALVAVGGRSGAGKSALARALAPRLEPAPGALVVRSDCTRKRLAGVAPTARLSPAAYTPQAAEAVYARMLDDAGRILRAGFSVILDAAFLRQEQRDAAERLAGAVGAPFVGLWLEAPLRLRLARLDARRDDPSDADQAVARAQEHAPTGPISWARLDPGGEAEFSALRLVAGRGLRVAP